MNFNDDELSEKIKRFKEFIVYVNEIDESYGYSVVTLVNELSNKFNLGIRSKLAHNYDFQNKDNKKNIC